MTSHVKSPYFRHFPFSALLELIIDHRLQIVNLSNICFANMIINAFLSIEFFLECNRRNMRELHRYNLKINANGLVKDEDMAPSEMIWPDLIANLNTHSTVKSRSYPFGES